MTQELREREAFYRSMRREERRPPELRERLRPHLRQTSDGPVVEGYACVYDVWYECYDWLGPYQEMVAAGAATKTLTENPDVRYLVNHQGVPLGRTASNTLKVSQRDDGIWYETTALDMRNPNAQEITSALERGDVDSSSFAFWVTKQMWNEDYTERTIVELSLKDGDVSSVTYPANPYTSSSLRASELIDQLAVADLGELVGAARGRDDFTGILEAARGRLDSVLGELAGDRPEAVRDTSTTMNHEKARRRDLELLELAG